MSNDQQDPLIGATLAGRYKIVSRIARGGMSSVYLARHVLIGRQSAIKLLRRDLCDDPIQRDRFLREARAVNRINHPNIVEIVDYGESEDGRVFLVMEYLPGESLHQRLSRGAMPPLQAIQISEQIASGLARAHQMGVIHRDLKPDNVLLVPTEDGGERVKLLDFGIAKILDQPGLTASDRIFGTPGYIAPEYASGSTIDGRADLYSLGVVLFEMATGRLPFESKYQGELLLKHVREAPARPRDFRPDLPESIERIILRSLEKDPARRFRDAFHMLEELGRIRDELLGNKPTQRTEPEPAAQFSPTPAHGSIPPFPPPRAATIPPGAAPVPTEEQGQGPDGPKHWQRHIEALLKALSEAPGTTEDSSLPRELAQQFGLLQERHSRAEQLRSRLLALEARGRDFRFTIGRAMDTLAGDLSARERERDEIASEREALEKEKAALDAASKKAGAKAGASDAIVWRLAACDEVLRQCVLACEDVEFQLRELGTQLERLSEALETDQGEAVQEMNDALAKITESDRALRTLSERALQILE